MKRRPRNLSATAIGLALIASAPAAAGGGQGLPEPLATFTADYRVTNGTIKLGTTRIELQPHERGWRYRSVTEASGLLGLIVRGQAVDSTVLEPHGDWMRPLRYRHREPDAEDDVTVDFDWNRGRATARHDQGSRHLDLEPETVDGFSATLRLARALAKGEEHLSMPTIDDKGEHETLVFRRVGRERIEVPLGTFDTVRVDRVRRDSDRETITWLAPALAWVAVRIDQREDGELEGRLLLTDLSGVAAGGLARAADD